MSARSTRSRRGGGAAARPEPPARRGRGWWLLRLAAVAALVATVALGLWLFQLDRHITSTFEGRRWSIPARVFAQPLELYPGRALSADQLDLELERIGYASGPLDAPGTRRREGRDLRVHLRRFVFTDGVRPARVIRVRFDGTRISGLEDGTGAPLALARIEPPVIGSIFPGHGEDRLIVRPDETPELLLETLKVVEDRNFEQHHGFDPTAILRAAWVNLRSGRVEQGGSTLTQQLVKSYYLDNRRTLGRKLRELAMAVILELRFEKQDLLNAYVNEIYVGQDGARAVHGFGLASQFYFGRPLAETTPAQIALLVAVIRGPSYYNPFRHPDRARSRRNRVLEQMQEFDLIDAAAFDRALSSDLGVSRGDRRAGRYYPAFMDLVREQLERDYDPQLVASSGFRVFTSLEPVVQESAERAVRRTLSRIEAQRDLEAGGLQAAVVVTHAQTGEVQAVVGGRDLGGDGFNYAVDGRRPIGSLIKPLVYLSALEQDPDLHLASIIDDAPVALTDARGERWTPHNFSDGPRGPVPVIRALAESLNLATVQLGLATGVEPVAERIAELLGGAPPPAWPSLLLGALELSPLEVARLYALFSGDGFAAPVKAILAVEDRAGAGLDRYPLQTRQVGDIASVLQINHALTTVMTHGTGRGSLYAGRGVAGKTGTSDDYRDAWFVGFDATRLAVVWVGHGDGRSSGLTGSSGALPVWDAMMSELPVMPVEMPLPPGHRLIDVDFETGLRADAACGDPVTIPVPLRAPVRSKPGCRLDPGDELRNLGNRIRSWLD
jgi:penicillin-binding protein 1B